MPANSPKPVPASAVVASKMDLRVPMYRVSETLDDLFAVRNSCVPPHDSVLIDDYATATLTDQPILIPNCRRFGGNEVSAVGADSKHIYIKFGYDEEGGGPNLSESGHEMLVLDRKTHAEVGVSRVDDWLDMIDASGADLVGCNCLGTPVDTPYDVCLVAAKRASNIRFQPSQMRAAIACLKGPNAIKAARTFVAGNEGPVVGGAAVNEKYIAPTHSPHAINTVETPTRQLDMSLLPPGYAIKALGTGPTSDLAVVSKTHDQTVTAAVAAIPGGRLTGMTVLPLPSDKDETPSIHLYAKWLVAASGDTLFVHQMSAPQGSFVYRTDKDISIEAADLYGHYLFVQLARDIPDAVRSAPASLQIDLDLLAKD
jgi:hypothetical protein